MPVCPNGHTLLKPSASRTQWLHCDSLSCLCDIGPSDTIYSCASCDWDLCEPCHNALSGDARSWRDGRGPESPSPQMPHPSPSHDDSEVEEAEQQPEASEEDLPGQIDALREKVAELQTKLRSKAASGSRSSSSAYRIWPSLR